MSGENILETYDGGESGYSRSPKDRNENIGIYNTVVFGAIQVLHKGNQMDKLNAS